MANWAHNKPPLLLFDVECFRYRSLEKIVRIKRSRRLCFLPSLRLVLVLFPPLKDSAVVILNRVPSRPEAFREVINIGVCVGDLVLDILVLCVRPTDVVVRAVHTVKCIIYTFFFTLYTCGIIVEIT